VSNRNASSNCVKASRPPAEAPTPTIGNAPPLCSPGSFAISSSFNSASEGCLALSLVWRGRLSARPSLLRALLLTALSRQSAHLGELKPPALADLAGKPRWAIHY